MVRPSQLCFPYLVKQCFDFFSQYLLNQFYTLHIVNIIKNSPFSIEKGWKISITDFKISNSFPYSYYLLIRYKILLKWQLWYDICVHAYMWAGAARTFPVSTLIKHISNDRWLIKWSSWSIIIRDIIQGTVIKLSTFKFCCSCLIITSTLRCILPDNHINFEMYIARQSHQLWDVYCQTITSTLRCILPDNHIYFAMYIASQSHQLFEVYCQSISSTLRCILPVNHINFEMYIASQSHQLYDLYRQ